MIQRDKIVSKESMVAALYVGDNHVTTRLIHLDISKKSAQLSNARSILSDTVYFGKHAK